MFGAFGFLALGMVTYMLRIAAPSGEWDPTNLRRAFWAWNVGLALMVGLSLLPVGFLQLEVAFTESYDAARSLAFYEGGLVQLLFWARMPGDALIILGTVLFGYDATKKVLARRATTPADEPGDAPVATGSAVETDD
jgi:nitric oxide reductase subunit B